MDHNRIRSHILDVTARCSCWQVGTCIDVYISYFFISFRIFFNTRFIHHTYPLSRSKIPSPSMLHKDLHISAKAVITNALQSRTTKRIAFTQGFRKYGFFLDSANIRLWEYMHVTLGIFIVGHWHNEKGGYPPAIYPTIGWFS